MYTLVNASCIGRTIGSQWITVDLSNILVFDIYNTYQRTVIEVSNPYLDTNCFVDLNAIRGEFSSFNGTLNELLTHIGSRTLPYIDEKPSTTIHYAKYSDAVYSGYKVNLTKIGYNYPADYHTSEFEDLVVTRPNYETDLSLIHTHCLVSVNGYIHNTDCNFLGDEVYIPGGGLSMRISKMNHLGILSFYDIGEITKIPITESMLHIPENTSVKDRVYIGIDANITNKSVILVLGGYLVFLEPNVLWQSGTNELALNLLALPLLERYYESKLYIPYTALHLPISTINPEAVCTTAFYSDDNLIKYLTLPQSFIALIDTPILFTNKIYIKHSSLPGMFTSYQDPSYPLVVNYGKIADYWKTKEDGYWSVTVTDSYFRNFNFTHQPIFHSPTVTNQMLPMKPYMQSRGHLLEIGSY